MYHLELGCASLSTFTAMAFSLFSEMQIRRHFISKRNVTTRTHSQRMTVDEYFAVLEHTVKFYRNRFVCPIFRQGKCFAVPAFSTRQSALFSRCWIIFTECSLYTPIVGQLQSSPIGGAEIRINRLWIIS